MDVKSYSPAPSERRAYWEGREPGVKFKKSPLEIKLKRHRFRPFKLRSMQNTPYGYACRQQQADKKNQDRREAENKERLKRLRVDISFSVIVMDEKGKSHPDWVITFQMTAPPPDKEVSDTNRFVAAGKDWWNNENNPGCWAYIQMLHKGEAKGGRPVVTCERRTPKDTESKKCFDYMSEGGRLKCEQDSCIRFAHDAFRRRDITLATATRRSIHLYMIGCARCPGYLEHNIEAGVEAGELYGVFAEEVPWLKTMVCPEVKPRRLILPVLPVFNFDLTFNPLTQRVVFPAYQMISPFITLASVKEGPVPDDQYDIYRWYCRGLSSSDFA